MSMQGKTVICTICLNILFQPVVLPCNHEFCKLCLLKSVEYNSYQCPICRYRLSNWLRKIKNIDSVICTSNENQLRSLFPTYYGEKELGKSPCLSKSERKTLEQLNQNESTQCITLSSPGALYAEYLKESENYTNIRLSEENENEEASLALAAQLLAEDSLNLSDNFSISKSPEYRTGDKMVKQNASSLVKEDKKNVKIIKEKKSSRNVFVKHGSSILEYTVDKRPNTRQSCSSSKHDQIIHDEEFARKLQSQYLKEKDSLKK